MSMKHGIPDDVDMSGVVDCSKCGKLHGLDECPAYGTQLQHQISDEDFHVLNAEKRTHCPICDKLLSKEERIGVHTCNRTVPDESLGEPRARDVEKAERDTVRTCEFCGCNTNAKMRACNDCLKDKIAQLRRQYDEMVIAFDEKWEKVTADLKKRTHLMD